MVELDGTRGEGGGQKDEIKCSNLEKKKEKNKMAQGKGIIDRNILFYHSRHQVGVSGFRIDIRTMKRGETHL